jgi:hypothetical protein
VILGLADGEGGEALLRQRRDRLRQEPQARVAGLDHISVRTVEADQAVIELHFIAPAAPPPAAAAPLRIQAQNLVIRDAAGAPPGAGAALRVVAVEAEGDPRRGPVTVHLAGEHLQRDGARHELEIVGLPEIDRFFARASFTLAPAAAAGSSAASAATAGDLADGGAAPAGAGVGGGGAAPGMLPRWAAPLTDGGGDSLPVAIDYLAKDYESFRQLMLSQMAADYPQWNERNPVDLGVAIVEVLAYAADSLSYYQDAVGAEAYLDTARRRISVRRHARLVDYYLHEGSNARTWVQVFVAADPDAPAGTPVLLPVGTQILTGGEEPGRLDPGSPEHHDAVAGGARVFETMTPVVLWHEHNQIALHDWGVEDFQLPAGATSAALAGSFPHLNPGHVLEIWEAKSPRTGAGIDRDARRCWPVRLVAPPRLSRDSLDDAPITEITWAEDDALPFSLWVSRRVDGRLVTGLAVACANVVLADQGRTVVERLVVVPDSAAYRPHLERTGLTWATPLDAAALRGPARDALEPRPRLALPAIVLYELGEALFVRRATGAAATAAAATAAPSAPSALLAPTVAPEPQPQVAIRGFTARGGPPSFAAPPPAPPEPPAPAPPAPGPPAPFAPPAPAPRDVGAPSRPAPESTPEADAELELAALEEILAALGTRAAEAEAGSRKLGLTAWLAQRDLLSAGRFSRAFVVETESDGRAYLRFGDGTYGWRPTAGSRFFAVYRIGNGTEGNVGALSLTQVVTADPRIAGCSNTIAAYGGTDPEDLAKARLAAPEALYQQERCVTAADCEEIAERVREVRKARAIDRWTGSWRVTCLYVQRHAGRPTDAAFLRRVRARVAPALLAGADLKLSGPLFVPLEIVLAVKVADGYRRAQVERLLLAALGDSANAHGERGFFYPDHFTFGQTVYLAAVLAAARRVPGVAAAEALTFKRLGEPPAGELLRGEIAIAPQEIAMLRTAGGPGPLTGSATATERGRQGLLALRLEGGQ